ncbi:unnamed protein product [Camellia sinensis]
MLQASLPFVVYTIFSAIDLIGIYQGLKHVHQQTLTESPWDVCIPSPADVSEEEGIDFMWNKDDLEWQKPSNKAFSFVYGKGLALQILSWACCRRAISTRLFYQVCASGRAF